MLEVKEKTATNDANFARQILVTVEFNNDEFSKPVYK